MCVKVGTADNVPPGPYVNDPEVNTKLVEGVNVPCVSENAPVTVHVVQVIVPMLFNVPAVYAAAPDPVKLNVAKSTVPEVCVYVVTPNAPANVKVPAPILTEKAAIVFPFGVIVLESVPIMAALKPVNVPPLDNVKLPAMFNAVAGIANAVVPKSRLSNQLAVVNVCTAVPLPVSDKLGAIVADPPVVPKT